MVITVSILQENFLTKCIIATSRGGAYDVLGEVQKFSGEVQNYFRGGAHLKIRLSRIMPMCKYGKQRTFVILIHETKGMECCAQMSSSSWGGSSTQRAAIKETMLPKIF